MQQRRPRYGGKPMTWEEFSSTIWVRKENNDIHLTDFAELQSKAHVGLKFQKIKYDHLEKDKLLFPVCVGAIYNPSKFWVVTQEERYVSAFDHLNKEINEFYNGVGADWKVEESTVTIGLPIAFPLAKDGTFYRGMIINDIEEPNIKVFAPDDGSFHKVPRNLLRYLRVSFLILPTQALPATLATINDNFPFRMWNQQTVSRHFRRLVANKTLLHASKLKNTSSRYLSLNLINKENRSISSAIYSEQFRSPYIFKDRTNDDPEIAIESDTDCAPEYEAPPDHEKKRAEKKASKSMGIYQTNPPYRQHELCTECPMCHLEFDVGEKVKRLPCGHIFHEKCVVNWLSLVCKCPNFLVGEEAYSSTYDLSELEFY